MDIRIPTPKDLNLSLNLDVFIQLSFQHLFATHS